MLYALWRSHGILTLFALSDISGCSRDVDVDGQALAASRKDNALDNFLCLYGVPHRVCRRVLEHSCDLWHYLSKRNFSLCWISAR